MSSPRKCYLMIEDLDGQEGVQWGVDFGLKDGESLPEDVEELTQAQFTIWRFVTVLRGWINDNEEEAAAQREAITNPEEKPSGLLLPFGQKLDS